MVPTSRLRQRVVIQPEIEGAVFKGVPEMVVGQVKDVVQGIQVQAEI